MPPAVRIIENLIKTVMTLKALILVGGFGTRLRPLTLSKPKPLVDFANKPIVMHQIEALVKTGVTEIVLAVSYQSDALKDYLQGKAKELGITITFSKEDEPLGTAGPLALARHHLEGSESFFVLNSDVICEFPFQSLLEFHRGHHGEGTIFVTQVDDPSKYGVVLSDANGQIQQFVEKPETFVGDKINAGLYIFNTAILDRIEAKPTSIETDVFPIMASEGKLYNMVLPGFWMDVGQPKDYLRGITLFLNYLAESRSQQLSNAKYVKGNVMVHPTSKIGSGCQIGPNVVIGENCVIGDGVNLSNCAILDGSVIDQSAFVRDSIVGWGSSVKAWARVCGAVLGEDVCVRQGVSLQDVVVLLHKSVKSDQIGGIIM